MGLIRGFGEAIPTEKRQEIRLLGEAATEMVAPPPTQFEQFTATMKAEAVKGVPNYVWVGVAIALGVGGIAAATSMKKK
jgi:hypothetical protein